MLILGHNVNSHVTGADHTHLVSKPFVEFLGGVEHKPLPLRAFLTLRHECSELVTLKQPGDLPGTRVIIMTTEKQRLHYRVVLYNVPDAQGHCHVNVVSRCPLDNMV